MLIVGYYRLVEAAADPFVQMLIGQRSRTVVFTGNVDLNRTISSFVTEHEKRIVLRARFEQAPGYLRGFCCHAYAEGRWVLVGPTPASGIPLGTDRTGAWDTVSESFRALWTDVFTNIKRGYFATVIVVSLGSIGRGISWIFWYGPWYIAWPLLVVAAILLMRWHRPRRPKDAWVRELQWVRSRLEHFMARHHVHRQHWMTIGDLIRRIDDAKVSYDSESAALLTECEALRYATSPPGLETIDSYARRVAAWISGH